MKNPKREYKVIYVPMPQMNMGMLAGVIGISILLLGMLGYIIGDIRTPPAPVSEHVVIVATATPLPATPTSIPTSLPTTQPTMPLIQPTVAPVDSAEQPTWGVQIVIDTPVPAQPVVQEPISQPAVEQPVVAQAAPAGNAALAYVQQAMSARTVPSIDEATCHQQVAAGMENKWENNTCYIRGPLDAEWTAIGVEYPEFSCERSLYAISGSYSAANQICTVTYNGTTTRWSWTGSGWQLVG